jgi:hypothetical protein
MDGHGAGERSGDRALVRAGREHSAAGRRRDQRRQRPPGRVLRRQRDRKAEDGAPSKTIVRTGAHGRLGDRSRALPVLAAAGAGA